MWDNLAEENQRYLQQYLTNDEIKTFFRQSKYGHIFTHILPDGSIYWEARTVNPKKVLSSGSKPFLVLGEGCPTVIVEDLVSAIVVARETSSMPLFGSHLSSEKMAMLAKVAKEAVVWLDPDKRKEALLLRNKLNVLVPTRVIFTDYDPKEEKNLTKVLAI